jgi:hypothetical protein
MVIAAAGINHSIQANPWQSLSFFIVFTNVYA